MERQTLWRYSSHILMTVGISVTLMALLVHFSLGSVEGELWPRMLQVAINLSPLLILAYTVAIILRTILQSLRYRLILQASETDVPGFFHLLLVSACRNMFVDMLPARLGELSYVAMLNRGYKVALPACLSSLAISFVFDLFALGIIIVGIIAYQAIFLGVQFWVVGTLFLLTLVVVLLLLFLFPGLATLVRLLARVHTENWGRLGRLFDWCRSLLSKIVQALQAARDAGITARLALLSLGIRVTKYLGFYALFLAVVVPNFPLIDRHLVSALVALISAEAGASMPVPAFMGFGTYEAAGMLAMIALGAERSASLIIMFSIHILSQVVDYAWGGLAFIVFIILTRQTVTSVRLGARLRFSWYGLVAIIVFCIGVAFLVWEVRSLKNLGALRPPASGHSVLPAGDSGGQAASHLAGLNGYVVWSSNRSGSHDIWMYTLPEGELRQLTTDSHTDYYPRISPDGGSIVFARSQEPWVSQRNYYAWDVMLMDLRRNTTRLLARNGNVPTWSGDGRKVYFQRNGNQLVQVEVASGRKAVVMQTGQDLPLPASVQLQTPVLDPTGQVVAVTLRGGQRATSLIYPDKRVVRVGGGCQLNWSPAGDYLYKIDRGGQRRNAVIRVDPTTLDRQVLFDPPGEYHHIYFPRVDNTDSVLVYGASTGGHEHDTADYEIFLWRIGTPASDVVRLTHHTANDCWPDVYITGMR
ncbi:lysylphosphatidylglycerol synthase domain-containing protein [Desulfobulbus alkaliphilus]|uniref:lysylphosphatidylglycerol synthase domain-containing protein n=1 Tax=Desulfobulbus alkaliphilus TaxID=869814 RepID=UPI0019626F5D|nr:lysylphosphatidylglycerol synthase domain-containing protein [Desulfobulbus alkaliphilus]MBM9538000.1 flippase-like domain-containing protein [Desulfobulbus alkaliphilus]